MAAEYLYKCPLCSADVPGFSFLLSQSKPVMSQDYFVLKVICRITNARFSLNARFSFPLFYYTKQEKCSHVVNHVDRGSHYPQR